ncbi:DHH family phosphoesterase [Desulfofalx alkaliphila]|uniref:DHH family phosphoesterase n=1 Tax=Desulfofalx alkaliphila TaxID=105483 RepID=UPI0004E20821|nr:bifunctional oligoribonuclease/PAP phosphatase NrnA [Desulfofalx alkaliphila]
MNSFVNVVKAMQDAQNIIISGHVTPDGDSIGSTLALAQGLNKLGKNVTVTSPDPIPEIYQFLPGVKDLRVGLPLGNFDTFVVLDCSVPWRLGDELQELLNNEDVKVVCIDHHPFEQVFGNVNYIDIKAAATGEIIYDLLIEMNIELDLDIAINLYTAIATDTGSFRYENTTAGTHRRVGELLNYGVPVAKISNLLYDEKPLEVFKVLQRALPTLGLSACGKVAWICVDWNTKQLTGAKDEHTDDLISYPRRIKGVDVALMFREQSPGLVKVSMRSNYRVDVNKLAGQFNGGGHKRASGCLIKGDFNSVQKQVVTAAIDAVRRGN